VKSRVYVDIEKFKKDAAAASSASGKGSLKPANQTFVEKVNLFITNTNEKIKEYKRDQVKTIT